MAEEGLVVVVVVVLEMGPVTVVDLALGLTVVAWEEELVPAAAAVVAVAVGLEVGLVLVEDLELG